MQLRRVTHPLFFILALACMSYGTRCLADSIRGEVSTSGAPATRKALITPESGNSSVIICPGPLSFQLIQLAGTILTIHGPMQNIKKSNQPCIHAESYEIHEIARGRPAIMGNLKMIEKGKYGIVNENGKVWLLAKLPPGLNDYINQNMIMDLVANDASSKETTWLVARAYKLPTP